MTAHFVKLSELTFTTASAKLMPTDVAADHFRLFFNSYDWMRVCTGVGHNFSLNARCAPEIMQKAPQSAQLDKGYLRCGATAILI